MSDNDQQNDTTTKINNLKNKDINVAMSDDTKKVWEDQISYGLEKYERRWIKKRSPSTMPEEES